MSAPNWYDVLDVDSSATTDEIRAAWRDAIADLTPADRRFRLYNQAAEVLLDPEQRAAHDAELARQADQPEPAVEPGGAETAARRAGTRRSSAEARPERREVADLAARRPRRAGGAVGRPRGVPVLPSPRRLRWRRRPARRGPRPSVRSCRVLSYDYRDARRGPGRRPGPADLRLPRRLRQAVRGHPRERRTPRPWWTPRSSRRPWSGPGDEPGRDPAVRRTGRRPTPRPRSRSSTGTRSR